jgi:hypothetical protein
MMSILCEERISSVRAFEDAKIEQLIPFMRESHFTRRQLAELTWQVTNENIDGFLDGVPSRRWLRLRFEDLVREPRGLILNVCGFLGRSRCRGDARSRQRF